MVSDNEQEMTSSTVDFRGHETTSDAIDFQKLKEENNLLRQTVHQLNMDNQRLQEFSSMIVIESFERESQNVWYDSSSLSMQNNRQHLTGNQLDDSMWCDELDGDTCPTEPTLSFFDAMQDRARWLVGLLVLQSCSGFILSHNEALLERHPVIIYFLTMLVGAGGNAGNQASVRGTHRN